MEKIVQLFENIKDRSLVAAIIVAIVLLPITVIVLFFYLTRGKSETSVNTSVQEELAKENELKVQRAIDKYLNDNKEILPKTTEIRRSMEDLDKEPMEWEKLDKKYAEERPHVIRQKADMNKLKFMFPFLLFFLGCSGAGASIVPSKYEEPDKPVETPVVKYQFPKYTPCEINGVRYACYDLKRINELVRKWEVFSKQQEAIVIQNRREASLHEAFVGAQRTARHYNLALQSCKKELSEKDKRAIAIGIGTTVGGFLAGILVGSQLFR